MKYSLLLHHLAPKPSREALEEITRHVGYLAKPDALGLLNGWYGIIDSGISHEDVILFQNALQEIGIGTHVVPDNEVPALHADFRCQRIDFNEIEIILTDAMGRSQARQRHECVFIAAGFLNRQRPVTQTIADQIVQFSSQGIYQATEVKKVIRLEEKNFFRIDLFFTSAPHRISYEIGKDTVILHGETRVRIENTGAIRHLMSELKDLMPECRVNQALREMICEIHYPSLKDYEEEIRWAFYGLGAQE